MSQSETKSRPSCEYVMGLAKIMSALGVTRLVVADVTLERPLPMPEEPRPTQTVDEREAEFARIQSLPPDKQEAELRLRRLGAT